MSKRSRSSHSKNSDDSDSVSSSPNSINTRQSRRQSAGGEKERCIKLFDRIKNYKDEDGTMVFDMFWAVPPKRSEPEYYEVIERPIDLSTIQTRVRDDEYKSLDDLQREIQLLCDNVKKFYEDDTEEYAAADLLMEVFQREKEDILNHTIITSLNNSSSSESTPKISPVAKRGRPSRKIKIEGHLDMETDKCSESTSVADSEGSTSVPSTNLLYQNYFVSLVKHVSDDGRPFSAVFTHLPSRKRYPDYYEVISDPIDFKMVAEKLQSGVYKSLQEMNADFQKIAKNAKTYNEPHSAVYEDAKELSKVARQKCSELEKTCKKPIRGIPGAVSLIESYAKAKPPEDDGSAVSHNDDSDHEVSDCGEARRLEVGKDIRFPSADPRYPFRRLYDSISKWPICEPFMRLPSAKLYPDYFEEIKTPISMLMIRGKINNSHYQSMEELVRDFDVMFHNAQVYNMEGSEIFKNSVKLQAIMRSAAEEISKSLPSHMQFSGNNFQYNLASPTSVTSNNSNSCPQYLVPPSPTPSGSQQESVMVLHDTSNGGAGVLSVHAETSRHTGKVWTEESMLRKRLEKLYNAVYTYQENGRFLNEIFLELPSKEEYPDYYEVIPEPIDLTMIKRKMDKNLYKAHSEMAQDLRLMFNNAKHYNEEGSQVYNDAMTLEEVMRKRLRNLGPTASTIARKSSVCHSSARADDPRNKLEHRHMQELYMCVKEYRDPQSGLQLAAPLMRLPTRQELPQYYKVIRRPVELLGVGQRLQLLRYQHVDELMTDLLLMLDNATTFHESASHIHQSACTLRRVLLEKKATLTPDTPTTSHETATKVPDVSVCVCGLLTKIWSKLMNVPEEKTDPQPANKNVTTPSTVINQSSTQLLYGLLSSEESSNHSTTNQSSTSSVSIPAVFDTIRANLNANKYRRLDHFQVDLIHALRNLRTSAAPGSQEYADACEMSRRYVKIRDEVTENGKRLASPALRYTAEHLLRELQREEEASTNSSMKQENGCEEDVLTTLTGMLKKDVRLLTEEEHSEFHEQEDAKKCNSNEDEEKIKFEQILLANGSVLRLGDFLSVIVPTTQEQFIVAFHQLWRTSGDESIHYSGPIYRHASDVSQSLTNSSNTFSPQEVVLTDKTHSATLLMNAVVSKCLVLDLEDYCTYRPTQYAEKDVYLCSSKFLTERRLLNKLKNAVTKFHWGPEIREDEVFFFPETLKMKKMPPATENVSAGPVMYEEELQLQIQQMQQQQLQQTVPVRNYNHPKIKALSQGIPPEVLEEDKKKKQCRKGKGKKGQVQQQQQQGGGRKRGRPLGSTNASKDRPYRNPPSGYVLYAGEKRKYVKRPEMHFGDVSREIGSMWRGLPNDTKQYYEKRAKIIRLSMEEGEKSRKKVPIDLRPATTASPTVGTGGGAGVDPVVTSQNGHPGMGMKYPPHSSTAGVLSPHIDQHGQASETPQQHYIHPQHPHPLGHHESGGPATSVHVQYQQQVHPVMGSGMYPTYHPGMTQVQQQQQQQVGHVQNVMSYPPGQHASQYTATYPHFQQQQQQQVMNMGMMSATHYTAQHAQQAQMMNMMMMRPRMNFSPQQQQQQVQVQQVNGCVRPSSMGGPFSPKHQQQQQQQHVMEQNGGGGVLEMPRVYTVPPLFVPVPPKPVKLLHSKVYSRHIESLRRHEERQSDWERQVGTAAKCTQMMGGAAASEQVAGNFLSKDAWRPQHDSAADALWALRDHLLRDALNIKTKLLGLTHHEVQHGVEGK